MTIDLANSLPYLLLWLALGMAMFSRVRWSWPIFTGLSIAAAVIVGIVEWPGLAVITLFAGACLAAMQSTLSAAMRTLACGVLVICAVALASHRVPWINNVLVVDAVGVSPSAELYTLYWNYDKALVGVLLYVVCVQLQRRTQRISAIVSTAVAAVLAPALVVVAALAMKFAVWDPKWPAILVMWVPANLLVTCLAEEAFFRGFLQRYLTEVLRARVPLAGLVALFVAAVAFGIAHIAGGIAYTVLATLAGIGYGAAYHVTQRVEASILVHFTLNLVHLMLFTYPFIASG